MPRRGGGVDDDAREDAPALSAASIAAIAEAMIIRMLNVAPQNSQLHKLDWKLGKHLGTPQSHLEWERRLLNGAYGHGSAVMDMVNQGLTGDPADDPNPGDDGYDTGNTDARRTTFTGIYASLELADIGPKIKNIKSGDVEKLIRQLRHEYKASNQARLGMIRSAVSVKRTRDFPSVLTFTE